MSTGVKVSGFVSDKEHLQLVNVAAKHKTTVGNLVSFSIREGLRLLKSNPDTAAALKPDKRRATQE